MPAGSQFPLSVILTAVDRLTGPLGRMESRIGKFGKSLGRVGRSMTLGLTAPILGFGAAVLTSSAKFEEGMLRVQALTGETAEDLSEAREQAKRLGSSTVFSATQAADAMGNLALAGFDLNEIQSATPAILDLATAASIDLGEAARIAAGGLNAYGFEADQIQRVSDVLTKTFTSSATTLEDLGEAFKDAAPIARGMGIEFEELSATIGLLGDNVFIGSKAGTAIRGALARLSAPTKAVEKVLARLNIPLEDLVDGEGNVKSLANTIRQLEDAGAATGQILELFGQKAGPAMAALLGEGSAELERMTTLLKSSTGTAAEIAAVRMQGAAGGVRALKSAFEGLTIAIGESGLLEWFTEAIGKLTAWFQKLTETSPELLRLGTVVALVAAALGPFLIVAGAAVTAIAGLTAATGAFGAALTFLAANPIGVAVLSLGALIAGATVLVTQWDRIVAGTRAVVFWIGSKLAQAFSFLGTQIASLVDLVPDWLVNLFGAGIRGFDAVFGGTAAQALGVATGAPTGAGLDVVREERTSRSTVEVLLPNLPPGARVDTEGDFEDVELGISMAPT